MNKKITLTNIKNKVQTIHFQLNNSAAKKLYCLKGEKEYSVSAVVIAAINLMYQIKGYEELN